MNERIPELGIELMDDPAGAVIILEQDSGGNIDRVAIHPLHIHYMAEKFGLVESGDAEAARTVTRMVLEIIRADYLRVLAEVGWDPGKVAAVV